MVTNLLYGSTWDARKLGDKSGNDLHGKGMRNKKDGKQDKKTPKKNSKFAKQLRKSGMKIQKQKKTGPK